MDDKAEALAREKLVELEWNRFMADGHARGTEAFIKRWPGSRFDAAARAKQLAVRRRVERSGGGIPWKMAAGIGAAATVLLASDASSAASDRALKSPEREAGQVAVLKKAEVARKAAAAERRAKVSVMVRAARGRDEERWLKPGKGKTEGFRDCINYTCTRKGPEMVVVPAGSFMMGAPKGEEGYYEDEGPRHKVTIRQPFAVGKFEVTFAEWDACVDDGGCKHKPATDWGRGDQPVMRVSWEDITNEYLPWLRKKTGKDYRLLSEAEWEYVARAGTETPFWWGRSITTRQANYDGDYTYGGGSKGEDRKKTVPVKSFQPNPWGLYQVHGNVDEWTEDCRNSNYDNAPTDGSARTIGSCSRRVLRGGSWIDVPRYLRSAIRNGLSPDGRNTFVGFRLSRTF